jgi:hypothetical protein
MPKSKAPLAKRKTFMLDPQSQQDAERIRTGLRATTASEAIRFSVRKIAELMDFVSKGGRVLVDLPHRKEMVVIDIPRVAAR